MGRDPLPGLDPAARYRITDVTPGTRQPGRNGIAEPVVTGAGGIEVSGAALGEIGLAIPVQRILSATVLLIEAV